MESLQTLNIRNNKIEVLPGELSLLRNLKVLDLRENPLLPPLDKIHEDGVAAIFEYLKVLNRETLKVQLVSLFFAFYSTLSHFFLPMYCRGGSAQLAWHRWRVENLRVCFASCLPNTTPRLVSTF